MDKAKTQSTILIVEDNPITRKGVRLALQLEDYYVLEAETGAQALAYVQAQPIDLVLLDLLLPDVHGADLVRQLRALPHARDIPIIAFSGFLSKLEELRVSEAGFTDFLLKPVEPSRLATVIRTYLVSHAEPLAPPERTHRVLVVDDDPVQLKLVRLQLTQAGLVIAMASNGMQALEMMHAEAPELVITDVLMPQMDGFELCLEMRKDPTLKHIPVIMISANYLESADHQLAARVGASAFVHREQGTGVLLRAVFDALARPAAPANIDPADFREERHKRVVRQLERQTNLHAACAQRTSVQSAILHELGLIF